jgi:plastocyanin
LLTLGGFTYMDNGERIMRGRKEQELDAGAYYFKGTFLRGTPGQQITLSVRNVDQQLHNLSIPPLGVDLDIPIGKDRYKADITLPQSGALRFFCKLHAERGMNGQIIAGEGAPAPLTSSGPLFESW